MLQSVEPDRIRIEVEDNGIGRVAASAISAQTALESMPPEFPPGTELLTCLAEGAMDALNRGDDAGHDERVVEAARWLVGQGCDVIALSPPLIIDKAQIDRIVEILGDMINATA